MTVRTTALIALAAVAAGCASAPPAPAPPIVTWEQKLSAMMRLEDARVLREPPPVEAAPAAAPGRALGPRRPLPTDLTILARDEEGRVRRRAALAIGRVGMADGVATLRTLLSSDPEAEVRSMAAFALGLVGGADGAEALVTALGDPDARVQGRAAEGLGLAGHTAAAGPIAAMMAPRVASGELTSLAIDEAGWPLAPDVEAFRLGLYALVRLKAWDALASVVLDDRGQPKVLWWPVAYALQRIGDRRAAPALLTFARSGGVDAVAFAARGLGGLKEASAVPLLVQLADPDRHDLRVVAQAVRALGEIGDARARPALLDLARGATTDDNVRLEAVNALGALPAATDLDALLDLVAWPAPAIRGRALRALAALDPEGFVPVLSSLDPDPAWSVRAELATVLGGLPRELAEPKLETMLSDRDARVVPSVLEALVRLGAPRAHEYVRAALDHEDVVVRATAVRLLGERPAEGASALAAAAYERARTDDTYLARVAALDALAKLDPARAATALRDALSDKDWAVRRKAAERLAELAPGADVASIRPAPTGREPSYYDAPALTSPPYSPIAYVDTTRGRVEIELDVIDAPLTTRNFIELARRGFFDGRPIHRVVANFVVQDGDPRGDGEGGPGYTIRDELNGVPYLRGVVGMALDGPDTGGSQFFITHGPQPHLDARYTAFGRVVSGMDVVDRLARWDVIERVRVWDGVELRD